MSHSSSFIECIFYLFLHFSNIQIVGWRRDFHGLYTIYTTAAVIPFVIHLQCSNVILMYWMYAMPRYSVVVPIHYSDVQRYCQSSMLGPILIIYVNKPMLDNIWTSTQSLSRTWFEFFNLHRHFTLRWIQINREINKAKKNK